MQTKPLATKTLRQSVRFKAPSKAVYALLMESRSHAAFTNHKTSISPKLGGKISAYGGYIEGVNLELIPGKRIVQAWRAQGWPKGHHSEARFVFSSVPGGCQLKFTQTGIPASKFEGIKSGWIEHYWDRMKAYLARS